MFQKSIPVKYFQKLKNKYPECSVWKRVIGPDKQTKFKRFLIKYSPFILLLFFMFITRINTFNLPYERDEGEYAYIAQSYKEGLLPYRDIFDQKPPIIFFIFYISELINPGGVWGPRILSFIATFISAVIVYLIGKKQFGEKVGIVSMWFFYILLNFPAFYPFSANTEVFMLPPLLGATCLYFYNKENPKQSVIFLFGLLSSLAMFTKPTCLPVIVYIVLLWSYRFFKQGVQLRYLLKTLSTLFLGILLPTSIILFSLYSKGIFNEFIEIVFTYNLDYAHTHYDAGLTYFLYRILLFSVFWFPISILYFHFFIKNKNYKLLFLGFIVSSLLLVYRSTMPHHYIQLVPFLALVAAMSYVTLHEQINNQTHKAVFNIVFILIPLGVNIGFYILRPITINSIAYTPDNLFFESVTISKYIKSMTNPTDKILVIGNEPEIYYYSNRNSASKLIYTYPLTIPTKYKGYYENLFIGDLIQNKPKIVVYCKNNDSRIPISTSKKIDEYLNQKYNLLGVLENGSDELQLTTNVEGTKGSYVLYVRNN